MKKDNTDIMTRGMRNCNPLCIRFSKWVNWQGQRGHDHDGFVIFTDMTMGIRAALANIRTYNKKYNIKTVRDIITRWAPPSENHTEIYIAWVCANTLLTEDTECLWNTVEAVILVQAMARYESKILLTDAEVEKAQRLLMYGK